MSLGQAMKFFDVGIFQLYFLLPRLITPSLLAPPHLFSQRVTYVLVTLLAMGKFVEWVSQLFSNPTLSSSIFRYVICPLSAVYACNEFE